MSFNKEFLPKRDTVFTAMFLNKELCENVLNIILDEKVELIDILAEFQNNLKKAALNSIYFDIMTRTTDGTIITFDLQTSYEKRKISNRVVYYACREIAIQKVERSAYEDLKNVVVTFVLTDAAKKHTKKYRKIELKDTENGEVYSNLLTIYEINLKLIEDSDGYGMKLIRDFFGIGTQEEYDEFITKYKGDNLAEILIEEYNKVTSETKLKELLNLEKEGKFMIKLSEEERIWEREKGRREGREEGVQKSILLFVSRFRKLNLEDSQIISSLVADFNLTPEEANKYI